MKKKIIILLFALLCFNIDLPAFSKGLPRNAQPESNFSAQTAISSDSSDSSDLLSEKPDFDNACNIIASPLDSMIFARAIEELYPEKDLPAGELLFETAQHFLGTPYVAGTLEIAPDTPVINLHETDCILFVEMCCALVALLKENDTPPDFKQYCDKIVAMRYRKGESPCYASRLHYTSEWIIQNSEAGIFREITHKLGGKPLDQKFYFMTAHSEKYTALKDNPDVLIKIGKAEKRLGNHDYFQIPSADIPSVSDKIQTGDIVCFVSKTDGLDISHTGIAFREDKTVVRFIHASMREKRVVTESKTLSQYSKTGIRILRISLQ